MAYMSHRPCPSLRGKSGAKYSQRTHYISLVRILEPEMLCRRMETYKPPTQKTADRSTLSLELNLSFQISGCGRHNMTKSSTILIDPSAIQNGIRSMEVEGIHNFHCPSIGLYANIRPRSADTTQPKTKNATIHVATRNGFRILKMRQQERSTDTFESPILILQSTLWAKLIW